METWPYTNISPADFDALTEDERQQLEALTVTYLAEVERRRGQAETLTVVEA
jgi:hypothetical protein